MNRRSTYAAEARLYWIASSNARKAARRGRVDTRIVAEYCDEMDAIAHCTDWNRLKLACSEAVAKLEPYNNACAS